MGSEECYFLPPGDRDAYCKQEDFKRLRVHTNQSPSIMSLESNFCEPLCQSAFKFTSRLPYYQQADRESQPQSLTFWQHPSALRGEENYYSFGLTNELQEGPIDLSLSKSKRDNSNTHR